MTDAGGGPIVSGVESITFQFTEPANANGILVAREIDIFGIPVPSDSFPIGDVNQDGLVNFSDISPFIELLISGTFQNEADCNPDGAVNFSDIPAFIGILIDG